jgi:alpha-tubulin suppressor-like RCC1 family protein
MAVYRFTCFISLVLACAACASTVDGTHTHADAAVDSPADRSDVTPALDAMADVTPDALPDVPTLDRGCSTVACEPIEGMRLGNAARFVVHRDGTTRVWGVNHSGGFGLGTVGERALTPIEGPSLGPLRQLAVGGNAVCALTTTGNVHCWGTSAYGELGDGAVESHRYAPLPSPLLRGAVDLMTSGTRFCAFMRDRTLWCWGRVWNAAGDPQGDPSFTQPTPTSMPVPFDVASIAGNTTAGTTDCAIDVSQQLWCHGSALWGELTTDVPTVRLDFARIALPGPVISASVGYWTVCAVTGDGAVWCWGRNDAGQVPGREGAVTRPFRIEGVPAATRVSVGQVHVCALTREGAVWCWGNNEQGAVNPTTRDHVLPPQVVQGIPPMRDVMCLPDSCAQAIADGHVWCWGWAGDEPTETVVD